MPAPRDPLSLLEAARLYYIDDKSQAEIAKVMNTSRSNVSRMLTEAKRHGIVEVRLHDPTGRARDLEARLRKAFGLHDVLVAARAGGSAERLTEQVGTLSAQLLLSLLREPQTVAMSWGHTLQSMVWAVATDRDYNVQVVQLVGGMSAIANEISGHELVRELSARLGATYRIMHSPATFSSTAARDVMLAEPSIAAGLQVARNAHVAFVGIGTPHHGSSAKVLESLALSPEESDAFWRARPVGDVAARYYTEAGQPIHGPVEDHVLGVTLADLVAIPHVVGVAAGRAKAEAVIGALRGKLIDSLVCDEGLARSVLAAR